MKFFKGHPIVKHDVDGTKHFAPKVWLHNNFNHDIMLYGGVEFTYWAASAVMTFTSAHLAQTGFTSSVVGVIMACISIVGIIASTIIGDISDKVGSPRRVMMVCAVLASIAYALVPALLDINVGPLSLGVVFIMLWAFFSRPMQGLTESWVVSAADRKKTFVFGQVRYFGSISYAIVCVICGMIAKRTGTQIFTFYAYGVLCIPILLLAWYARHDEITASEAVIGEKKSSKKEKNNYGFRAAIKNYYLVMFLFCHCFVCMPMSTSVTFAPYKLMEITGSTTALGNISAIRALAEIPMLLGGSWIVRKFGIKKLFLFDMILFLISQLCFVFAQSMAMMYVGMLLMGTAYGAHLLGQVNYVYRITPKEAVASAQSLAVSFMLVASVLGSLIGGVLVDVLTTSGLYWFLFAVEAFALVLFVITFPLGKLLGKKEPDLSHVID